MLMLVGRGPEQQKSWNMEKVEQKNSEKGKRLRTGGRGGLYGTNESPG